MKLLVPHQFDKVAYFSSRQVYVAIPQAEPQQDSQADPQSYRPRTYVLDPDASDMPLDQMVNQWAEKTRAKITSTTPPQIMAYQEEGDREIRFFTAAILFLPATEGTHDPATPTQR
jgi:hypothetical protein